MRDTRIQKLADVLVSYSTEVKPGDVVAIQSDVLGSPLALEVYESVLRAGAHPVLQTQVPRAQELFYEHASTDQLEWIDPTAKLMIDTADVHIAIEAPDNTRSLTDVDPKKQGIVSVARTGLSETFLNRAASGDLRWVTTIFPTDMVAAEADMSLTRYEDLFYSACRCDVESPVDSWKAAAAETYRLTDWLQNREEVHITGPGTDITLAVAGRHWVAGDGKNNMPCGEFFTGPIENSANGHITFHLPTLHGGRSVSGIRFAFKDGKVVDAHADEGEEYLIEMLDSDEGARFLGELGIGCNFGIDRGTRSILLDEKIGGTVHLAIGQSYPETGGVNESGQHWDLICDLRSGGSIVVDGETFQQDGRFVV